MAILALSGSSALDSINHRFVTWAAAQIRADVVRVLDFPAPIFSVDLEREKGVPASMQALYDRLHAADGLILAMPEHNGGPPAMLKNAIDWVSRVDRKVFAMPTVLLSTSPGPRGGLTNTSHWAGLLPHWGATVVGAHAMGSFHQAFGDDGPTEPAFRDEVLASLRTLKTG
ncbi:MAG: NAD(P)H-dependent oxidoreductase [Proteobacteria bacterium]|nr:NAD(P)H-dependent oxidoreductase [Pseudomonadota bacterium]MCP4917798.1 NAD(P)H-dependent oxidoreductase [Pseudomonadota bacterium]